MGEAAAIISKLQAKQPSLSQIFLYDRRGSELYEKITTTQEYYLTRNEVALLEGANGAIACFADDPKKSFRAVSRPIIELGAGSGVKTKILLSCLETMVEEVRYVPIDVSTGALEENVSTFSTSGEINEPSEMKEHKDVNARRGKVCVEPLLGTVASRLDDAAAIPGRRTWLFLGSSLGNYTDGECVALFSSLAAVMDPRDRLIVGVDTPHGPNKAPEVIERAYNDDAGYTAAFSLNILANVNRISNLDFDYERGWRHESIYDRDLRAVITNLVAIGTQVIHDTRTGAIVRTFSDGEKIFIEQSRKFSSADMNALAADSALLVTRTWSLSVQGDVFLYGPQLPEDDGQHLLVEMVCDVVSRTHERARWIIEDVVGEDRLNTQPVSLRNTFAFYRGHMPAFSDLKAVQPLGNMLPHREMFRKAFERGIDPDVDDPTRCHWHSGGLATDKMPPSSEFSIYAREVADALRERVKSARVFDGPTLCALEHQSMHVETLFYLVAADRREITDRPLLNRSRWPHDIFARGITRPGVRHSVSHPDAAKLTRNLSEADTIEVSSGTIVMGLTPDERAEAGFAWDNELPSCQVSVDGFRVAQYAISNAQFKKFVEAKGYERPELWGGAESQAYQWVVREQRQAPQFFAQTAEGWAVVSTFGEAPLPIEKNEMIALAPVWVTLDEALAYCNWLGHGARLMSEAEYHRLFGTDECPQSRRASQRRFRQAALRGNNNFKFNSSTPVGTLDDGVSAGGLKGAPKLYDLVGNGWEWTGTAFAPFQGFQPLDLYPDYSADFFDDRHFVLKGGSPFTDSATVRLWFRNWYQPHYPYVMAKFRIVFNGPGGMSTRAASALSRQ